MIAITPAGRTAYVANFDSDTVTPITVATGQAGKPIKVGKDPTALALVP
jgi:YVTN family beta-propeller protein